MSKETVQFVEMVRRAARKVVRLERWCETCLDHTEHISRQEGTWEHLTCTICLNYHKYRTK